MDLGWGTVIQAVVITLCTWYMRTGSKRDTERASEQTIKSTAAQSTSDEILGRVKAVELELELVKRSILKDTIPDDRGSRR